MAEASEVKWDIGVVVRDFKDDLIVARIWTVEGIKMKIAEGIGIQTAL